VVVVLVVIARRLVASVVTVAPLTARVLAPLTVALTASENLPVPPTTTTTITTTPGIMINIQS
jgi:hypothetical protein